MSCSSVVLGEGIHRQADEHPAERAGGCDGWGSGDGSGDGSGIIRLGSETRRRHALKGCLALGQL
jgi:hypothetical protein